jgi:hypothetical protein
MKVHRKMILKPAGNSPDSDILREISYFPFSIFHYFPFVIFHFLLAIAIAILHGQSRLETRPIWQGKMVNEKW